VKPLAKMTFEEASRARSALMAISQIVREYMEQESSVIAPLKITTEPKIVVPEPHKAPRLRTSQSNKRNGGHLRKCANPDCTRKNPRFRAHRNRQFCQGTCGTHYFGVVRRFADIAVQENITLLDLVNTRMARHIKKYPWLRSPKHLAYAKKLIPSVSEYWTRQQERMRAKKRHEKGVTIAKNTPTAAAKK